jgi:hypothetical protein
VNAAHASNWHGHACAELQDAEAAEALQFMHSMGNSMSLNFALGSGSLPGPENGHHFTLHPLGTAPLETGA